MHKERSLRQYRHLLSSHFQNSERYSSNSPEEALTEVFEEQSKEIHLKNIQEVVTYVFKAMKRYGRHLPEFSSFLAKLRSRINFNPLLKSALLMRLFGLEWDYESCLESETHGVTLANPSFLAAGIALMENEGVEMLKWTRMSVPGTTGNIAKVSALFLENQLIGLEYRGVKRDYKLQSSHFELLSGAPRLIQVAPEIVFQQSFHLYYFRTKSVSKNADLNALDRSLEELYNKLLRLDPNSETDIAYLVKLKAGMPTSITTSVTYYINRSWSIFSKNEGDEQFYKPPQLAREIESKLLEILLPSFLYADNSIGTIIERGLDWDMESFQMPPPKKKILRVLFLINLLMLSNEKNISPWTDKFSKLKLKQEKARELRYLFSYATYLGKPDLLKKLEDFVSLVRGSKAFPEYEISTKYYRKNNSFRFMKKAVSRGVAFDPSCFNLQSHEEKNFFVFFDSAFAVSIIYGEAEFTEDIIQRSAVDVSTLPQTFAENLITCVRLTKNSVMIEKVSRFIKNYFPTALESQF